MKTNIDIYQLIIDNKVKIGKITKIYFGTPYEKLLNYQEIKNNHKDLRDYHELKEKLKDFCNKKNIICQDFEL